MKNNKEDILIKTFRKRLKNYEQPIEKDIWTLIEKNLALSPVASRSSIVWWRYAGVAASFLLIIGLGIFFYQKKESVLTENDDIELPVSPIIQERKEIIASTDNVTKEIIKNSSSNSISRLIKNKPISVEKIMVEIDTTQYIAISEIDTIQNLISDHTAENIPIKKKETQEKQEKKSTFFTENQDSGDDLWNHSAKKTKKNRKMSYALMASNNQMWDGAGGETSNPQPIGFSFENSMSDSHFIKVPQNQNSFSYGADNEEIVSDYNFGIPFSIGFTIRKYFSNDFAIESGLTYTFLSSEEVSNVSFSQFVAKDVRLNYLGIPVKLVYSFYHNNRLNIYVAAGGMGEKMIYGKEKVNSNGNEATNKLKVSELQWSVSGNIGINYRLVDHLGLFIEPGIGYYFNDGSDVMTVRKDSPFNYIFQGGIRLTY